MSAGVRRRPPAILAIDLGTAAARVGLVGVDGGLISSERTSLLAPFGDADGRSEQDPESWWSAIVASASRQVGAAEPDVVAICAVGHGPTCVATRSDGRAVRPAITWRDARAGTQTVEGGDLAAATGAAGWALGILPAALWIERHEPAAARAARWYLSTYEWLAYRLSGSAATSRLAGAAAADPSLGAAVGLPAAKIPPVTLAGTSIGILAPEPADALGLAAGVPVVAGTFDAAASVLGAGLRNPGDAIDTGGSSGGFAVLTADPSGIPGLPAIVAPIPGRWLLGGAMSAVGASLEWLRSAVLGGQLTYDELIAQAAATPPGDDGLLFLPYLAGERAPIHDPHARGAFVGLTLAHGRGHLARAVLEASGHALRHVAAPIVAAGYGVTELRVTGGPSHSAIWNQLKADVTGFPVAVPAVTETALLGAAILGAAGVGIEPDLEAAIGRLVRIAARLSPRPELRALYDAAHARYLALYPALAPILRPPSDGR